MSKAPRRKDEELGGVFLSLTERQRAYALGVREKLRAETGLAITLGETVRSIWSKAVAGLIAKEPLVVATPPPPPEESLSPASIPPPPPPLPHEIS